MTYNILNGGVNREAYILEVIQAAQPDVVILQEVYTEELLKSLSQSLGMSYFIGGGNKERKVTLLSKLSVLSFKSHHPVFPIWRNFIDTEIEYQPNKKVRIIGVHRANLGIVLNLADMGNKLYCPSCS
jgi:endonuclease/exonuclease/phosphatase family metal-dependent hydrolase